MQIIQNEINNTDWENLWVTLQQLASIT
jgi:hypothetical protein